MPKTLYLTTPLYYVNAAPHIGHSYTEVAADCLARYHRLRGREVFFLTGTDEHGQKIAQAAAAAGQPPQAFADQMVDRFRGLWTLLNIDKHEFIRTTDPRHVQAVQAILAQLHQAGALKQATYQGWYCTPDETFWTEAELGAAAPRPAASGLPRPPTSGGSPSSVAGSIPVCPACRRPLESAKEEGWYLPLETHQGWLRKFVADHRDFVRPESRYNELASLLEQPLPEYLCITRPRSRVAWGIKVPFSPEHTTYVWFDALLNYITVPGYPADRKRFDALWPADVHFIGKDILRHHAVYWPIMLHALGLSDAQMPRLIFAHGWWKIGEQKMSKSLGNIVDPTVVVTQLLKGQPFAADAYRYFLLREVPFGQDGSFSEDAILKRLGADLGNDLGNLVNRTLSMIERYVGGQIPVVSQDQLDIAGADADNPLATVALQLHGQVASALERIEFSVALERIMTIVSNANQYIEAAAPWKLAKASDKDSKEKLKRVLATLADVIRITAILLEPFMPSVAAEIWTQLGCGAQTRRWEDAASWGRLHPNQRIGPHPVLFPRQEAPVS